ncbi:hypothetical protein JZ751_005093 [Albula glossodonta]|uniref:Uncharacterized protein n=1 Tax=Albula glossodonta TaxID=121402 RepID=A0A8T2P4P6_9TELE|nr:hypothetical protein JZ751_005093 [Albula glossodonta]
MVALVTGHDTHSSSLEADTLLTLGGTESRHPPAFSHDCPCPPHVLQILTRVGIH